MAVKRGRAAAFSVFKNKKKEEKKTGASSKPQSSASSNKQSNSGRGNSQSSNVPRRAQGYTSSAQRGRENRPSHRQELPQRRNQQSTASNYGAQNRANTPTASYQRQRSTASTSSEMRNQREQRSGVQNRMNQSVSGMNQRMNRASTSKEMAEQKNRNTASTAANMRRQQEYEKIAEQRKQNLPSRREDKTSHKDYERANFERNEQVVEAGKKATKAITKAAKNFKNLDSTNYTQGVKFEDDRDFGTDVAKSFKHGFKEAAISTKAAGERVWRNSLKSGRPMELSRQSGDWTESEEEKKFYKNQISKSELRQAGLREKIKEEQAKIHELEAKQDSTLAKWTMGAASSGGGMAFDRLTGPMSLLTMGVRVTEGARGDVTDKADALKKEMLSSGNYSQEEVDELFKDVNKWDLANALGQGSIEALSEMTFGGIGVAAKYTPAGGILDKAVGKLTGRLGSTAIGRLGLGVSEEIAEEEIGNPLQTMWSNRIYGDKLQAMQEDSIRRAYSKEADTLEDNLATSENINSEEFLEQSKALYKKTGASDKEAEKLALMARDYFNARLEGDEKAEEDSMNRIVETLAGGSNSLQEKWTMSDAANVAGSTAIMTTLTGLPSVMTTSQKGNEYRQNYGIQGVKNIAKVVENLDSQNSPKAKAVLESIEKGKEPTGTQIYNLITWSNKAVNEAKDLEVARDRDVQARMKQEKLYAPIVDADYNLAPATEERFEDIVEKTIDTIKSLNLNMDEAEMYPLADVVAAYETGTITSEQLNELNIESPENRKAFESATGINLDEYTVKDKRGNIDEAASNIEMHKALFAKSTENYMTSARIEQEAWNDEARVEMANSLSSNMLSRGSIAVQLALWNVDPMDRGKFMLTGSAVRSVYEEARFRNTSWEEVSKTLKDRFPGVDKEVLHNVFNEAKTDRSMDEDANYGKQVKAGEPMDKKSLKDSAPVRVPGKVIDLRENPTNNLSSLSFITSAAKVFGVNIQLTDNLVARDAKGNEVLDSKGNPLQVEGTQSGTTIFINTNDGILRAADDIAKHELIHQIRTNAPEEFKVFARLAMDRMHRANPEEFKKSIQSKQEQYKSVDKNMTPEAAFEEMIANGSVSLDWEQLIADVQADNTIQNKSRLLEAIKNAVAEVLRKLRSLLSMDNAIDDEDVRTAVIDEIMQQQDVYDLLVRAASEAKANEAAVAIDTKQDEMNVSSYSLGYHAGDLGKSRVDDYAGQSYGRDTGHFGFGTYFVGNPDNLKFGGYGDRNIETVEFDNYNLFTPRTEQQAFDLHNALRVLDGFAQDYSEFSRFTNRAYDNSEEDEKVWNEQYYITKQAVDDADGVAWDLFNGYEIDEAQKKRIDDYIASLPIESRENIARMADRDYTEAQKKDASEKAVRERLAENYDLNEDYFKSSTWYKDPISKEDYIEKELQSTIDNINTMKEKPKEYWYYEAAETEVKREAEHWGKKYDRFNHLEWNLRSALNYKFSDAEIKEALKKTEEVVKGYGSRTEAERGLDSPATVFMKELGFEGVDVRHLPLLDTTGFGSVIYDLKGEDLARKNEIGTARFSISEQQDADYMKAVEDGDMETAQRMVDEAAERAGYIDSSEYQGTSAFNGKAPASWGFTKDERREQWNNGEFEGDQTLGDFIDDGIDTHDLEWLLRSGRGSTDLANGSIKAIQDVVNSGSKTITMYRSVPGNIKEGSFRNGDWITPNRDYAVDNANVHGWTDYNIIEQEVSVDDVWWDGNDINEWGYDDENGYAYQNTKNNRKLLDPVTYDDEGNVIPLSQRFNTESNDVRFSMSEPVEKSGDLIAVHNLSEDKLRGDFRLGGFPMPSIAVTNQNHEDFGEISLLFGSDTIDPKKDKANKVYSADAWTPTVPMTEYEADSDIANKAYRTIKELVEGSGVPTSGMSADLHYDNIQDSLGRERGFDGFITRMMEKPYIKYAFLKSQGVDIEVPYKEGSLQGHSKDVWDKLDEALPEMTKSEAVNMDNDEAMKLEPIIREIVAEDWINQKEALDIDEEKLRNLNPYKSAFSWSKVTRYLSDLVKFREEGKTIQVVDEKALENMLNDSIDKNAYREWMSNLFDGIVKDSGVRNQTDTFTPSGNRRSFKATHHPATLEGILKAMKEQGEKNVSYHTSTKTLRADTAKTFKSLDEIRKDKGKLRNLSEDEVETIYKELDDKFYGILNSIGEKSSREYDLYSADIIADVMSECAKAGYTKPEQIIKHYDNYEWTVSEQDAKDILALFDAIQNMPVNMFEAKPRRAVGFNEVKAAIVPDNTSEDILNELELMEIPVTKYNREVEGDRVSKVNEAADAQQLRFSISSDIVSTLEENFDEYKEDKTNLRIATEAIYDLQRVSVSGQRWSLGDSTGTEGRMDNRAESGISSAKTIAKGITTSLVNDGYIDFRGQKVESPEDLAKLCQVLRDPRYETFRLILTKGNKIVSFQSISARMPGVSPSYKEDTAEEYYERIRGEIKSLKADGFYMLHNHPSGEVKASNADLSLTYAAIQNLGSDLFRGHVILDHDKFGLIEENYVTGTLDREVTIKGQQTLDLIHEPEIDHHLLGTRVDSSKIVASVGADVNASDDYSVIIYVDSKLRVRGLQEMPNEAFLEGYEPMTDFIREHGREFGSIAAMVYAPNRTNQDLRSAIEHLYAEGVLLDAVLGQQGESLRATSDISQLGDPSMMGRTVNELREGAVVYESMAGVKDYNSIKYSITPKMDQDYMELVKSKNINDILHDVGMEEVHELVDKSAKAARYNEYVFHGTGGEFTEFDESRAGANHGNWSKYGKGFYFSDSEDTANYWGNNRKMIKAYIKLKNPYIIIGLEMTSEGPLFEAFNKLRRRQRLTTREEEFDDYMIAYLNEKYGKDYTTNLLKEHGYDGIIVEHPESEDRYSAAPWSGTIEYIVFDAENIKSAEAVTFDDDLSIIPLSERFNPENKDIRYSLPTIDAEGKVLTDGQMEYFKNSQARDEQGRLVPVYHTTNKGGFTVFDPYKSDDHRSLFFASNFHVSQTYGDRAYNKIRLNEVDIKTLDDAEKWAVDQFPQYDLAGFDDARNFVEDTFHIVILDPSLGDDTYERYLNLKKGIEEGRINPDEYKIRVTLKPIDRFRDSMYEMTVSNFVKTIAEAANNLSQKGYYKTYLNLENPMIVDAQGANWNRIPYGELSTNPIREQTIEYMNEEAAFRVDSVAIEYDDFDDNFDGGQFRKLVFDLHGAKKSVNGEWLAWEEHNEFEVDEDAVISGDEYADENLQNQLSEYWTSIGLSVDYLFEVMDHSNDFTGGVYYTPATDTQALTEDYLNLDGEKYNYEELFEDFNEKAGENYSPYEGIETGRRTYRTRELAELAQNEGYDGVIIRNCVDIGGVSPLRGASVSDIYIAFSSNQVKDVNNENPTENPDIRYSIVDEDEVKARQDRQFAYDNSYEALMHYEEMFTSEDASEEYDLLNDKDVEAYYRKAKRFVEKDVDAFYSGLTPVADRVVTDDPVLEEGRVRMARSKEDFFNSNIAKWNDRWLTDGTVLDVESVKKEVRDLVMAMMQNSDTDRQYKTGLVNKTLIDMRLAYDYAKRGQTDIASAILWHSAQKMIDNVEFYREDDSYATYKDLRDYLRTTKIALGNEYWSDVAGGEFGRFRKKNYGRLKLVKGYTNVDQIYQELEDRWPEWFNTEEQMTPPDMLEQISHVLDVLQPVKEAYSSEEAAEVTQYIAEQLTDIMDAGKELHSLADDYKKRLDEKTKAMKLRHEEAMRKVREQRDKGIKAEKAKWQVKEEKRKERASHKKAFASIEKSYKTLTERLFNNTADSHIPQQYKKELAGLLASFDMQTEGSKKREARTGHVAQKTIKLSAIKTALTSIENNTQLFHVNDAITDLIDELLGIKTGSPSESIDGLTIDELSVTELAKVDKLLKALVHEFNNYEKVRVGTKKQQAADIGKAQVDSALEHAKTFGSGKDYQNIPGFLDNIINLDEVTPAYMFRRIDPENNGLGLMWKEIRRSFDKYVRNQNQLNEWIDDIVGKYHKNPYFFGKYGAGELADWRSERYAKTFRLVKSNGSVTLTPAQMMSIYCLSKRAQAMDHMTGAGIVVAPVSYNAKKLRDVKKRANTALPVPLTEADIQEIISELTPEQIKVAEELQELLSTKMAQWGNEASMDVIGIELFNEKDYFPIKSDKAALTKDLNEAEFAEAIRNFGFTKAVQPGARNAIMVDDIFNVVTEHCNNMNLYNSYSATINDFMKVYNYRDFREDGTEYTVQQAVAHAYSKKATTFIMTFIRDLNGNVSGRASGIENMYNGLLANAKKASVFANLRVAAQQPTAIMRAFAEISPKYIKGIKIEKGAMEEMFEHAPIALWKSWGYYDINMGKSIEDIMMNEGKIIEDLATDLYGALDNVTWTAIWQMVKNEMKDTHPDVEIGTDEYWELCNERFSEIIDLTQVVDSPMHRSHAMRDKGFFHKMTTSFMAEPTVTFNLLKAGYVNAWEQYKLGNTKEATKIFARTNAVILLQAAAVSAAAGFVDALRGKGADDDDDDDEKSKLRRILALWEQNTFENFIDELKPYNKIYVVKDIASMFEGWDNRNLALQGFQLVSLGLRQVMGDPYARSSKSWYENFFGGVGYLSGIPVKTMMTGLENAMGLFGVSIPAIDNTKDRLDKIAELNKERRKESGDEGGYFSQLFSMVMSDEKTEASASTDTDSDTDTDTGSGSGGKGGMSVSYEDDAQALYDASREYEDMLADAQKAADGYEGEDRNKRIWQSVSKDYKKYMEIGDIGYLEQMRDVVEEMGGDLEYFDERMISTAKSTLKKSLSYESGDADLQARIGSSEILRMRGLSEEEISEVCYKSEMAKDLKVAFRLGDEKLILESAQPLVDAGLTDADWEKLWKNRNRLDIKKYEGKYKDQLKSQGTFIWPTQGTITSHFGRRNAPTAGASSNHPAIDIGAATGTPVVASDGGVVISAGKNGGYGNSVGIKHDNGMVTYYNHLYGWNVKEGDVVAQGQQIGQVGSTGISTGPHLDFKILDINGNAVDPEQYLQ